jgi:hypothetical protein
MKVEAQTQLNIALTNITRAWCKLPVPEFCVFGAWQKNILAMLFLKIQDFGTWTDYI